MKAKHIPNILSILRLMLVGVFIYTYFNVGKYVALTVFIFAGATDVLDGILARKFNWITNVGKILDPIADKSMQITVLICLAVDDFLIPWWLPAFFVIKEGLLAAGALFVFKKRDTVVSSRWSGKLAVCIFYAAIFIILVASPSSGVILLLSLLTICAAFELYNAAYLKIAVGKGYITWDDILDLVDIYFNVGVDPIQ